MGEFNELLFNNPVFNKGLNLTVRRGIKWSLQSGAHIENVGSVLINTQVMRFSDLTDRDLKFEHDPACRTVTGLYQVLQDTYPGFDPREIVTLVSFEVR